MEKLNALSMDQDFIRKLTNTVFENLNNEQFGTEELASEIGLSRSQIHRKLQKINGQSVTQFIREIRLKEAHRMLEENVGTASEIAYKVGFGSPTYFNKCFHEFYGYTPGEAKQRKTVTTESAASSENDKTRIFKIHPTSDDPAVIEGNRNNWLIVRRKTIFSAIAAITLALALFIVFKDSIKTILQEVSASSSTERSIAVIPFVFHGNDSALSYYGAGMVSEILHQLFKIGDLEVKSDIISKQFKNTRLSAQEIGKQFKTDYILKGSVLIEGNAIRISPELVEVRTNDLVWTDIFIGNISEVSEIFAIQSDVARQVALQVKAKISNQADKLIQERRLPGSNLAYQYYLRGQDYFDSKNDVNLALDMYSKAIEEDTLFAAAYARRSIMHSRSYFLKRSENWLDHDRMASEDIKKADQLDPGSIEIKIAQAVYHYYIDLNYELAINIMDKLKARAPTMSRLYAYMGYIYSRLGKWNESVEELSRALELEPFNVGYIINLSAICERLREFDKSIEIARDGLEKIPDHKGFRKRILAATRKKTGDLKLAMKVAGLEESDIQFYYYLYSRQFEKLIELVIKENRTLSGPNNFHPMSHDLAHAYFYLGDTIMSRIYADSAIQLLEKMLVENPLDHRLQAPLSKCYAFLGDKEQAIYYGKQSIKALPVEVDAIRGIGRENELVKTYVFLGEYDLALEKIEYLLTVPGFLTVGDLWLKPEYYELRRFPRFHEILRAHQPDSLYQMMLNQEN